MVMQAWGNYRTAWSVVTSSSACAPISTTACCGSCRRCSRPAQRGGVEHQAQARVGGRFATPTRATTKVDATRTPVRELVIGLLPHSQAGGGGARWPSRQALRGARANRRLGRSPRPGAQHADHRDPASRGSGGPPSARAGRVGCLGR
jgi:hypothetical protein